MKNVTVRKATFSDLDTLLRFEQGVIEAERPFDETLKRDKTHYYDLADLLRSEKAEVVVAELGNEVVGSGYARIEESKPYNQHRHHAYLGFMFVPEVHRGKGINGQILEALKRWALSKGVTEFRLEVYHENEAAIRAYQKAGFQKLLITMRMAIGGEE